MLLRRLLPALFAGALLLLPQACRENATESGPPPTTDSGGRPPNAGPGGPGPGEQAPSGASYYGGARDTFPSGSRSQGQTGGGQRLTVELEPTFDEARRVEEASLLLLAYRRADVNPSGFPMRGSRPAFQWQQPRAPITWPAQVELRLPPESDLRFYAVIDMDEDGRLGPGDHLAVTPGALTPPEDILKPLVLRIDRTLPNPTIAPQEPSGGCGGAPPPVVAELPQPRTSAGFHVDTVEHEQAEPAMVIVQGYSQGRLVEGNPPFGEPPDFYWSARDPDADWPLSLMAQLPLGLDVLVVVDADGDASPSPSDWSSEAVLDLQLPADGEPVRVEITRTFVPQVETAEDLPLDLPRELPRDDDDSAGSSAGAVEPPSQTATLMVLDSQPRVPFLRESTVMVVGYRAADVERGMPRSGARPISFWRSARLQLDWPLEVRAPLPSGTTLFLILDLDEDGLPSPGDLSSQPQPDYEPPADGGKASFVFQRAFGLVDPSE